MTGSKAPNDWQKCSCIGKHICHTTQTPVHLKLKLESIRKEGMVLIDIKKL
jgi:hypothetical protein